MTERSGNEIAVCVTKAARGAGVPLANAEDLGAAAIWLQGDLACICDALEAHLSNPASGTSAVCDGPALLAQFLADPSNPVSIENVDHPAILRALALQAARDFETPIDCEVEGAKVRLTLGGDKPTPPATGRANVADETWARLSGLLARTFVPASEASRLSGAGAGLTDND